MKAIVAVVVLSENRAESLVRPVYRDDGRGDSRDAPAASSAAPLGYSPSEDGPSGPVSRRGVDDLRFGGNRTNIKNTLGNGNRPGLGHHAHPRAEPCLGGQRRFQMVSTSACGRRSPNQPEPRSPRQQGRSARALCRTRTDDPFLTMEVLYQLS
jgi:hypothetical protein